MGKGQESHSAAVSQPNALIFIAFCLLYYSFVVVVLKLALAVALATSGWLESDSTISVFTGPPRSLQGSPRPLAWGHVRCHIVIYRLWGRRSIAAAAYWWHGKEVQSCCQLILVIV